MLTSEITDARAWRTDTLDDRSSWFYPLPEPCLMALERAIQRLRREPRRLGEVRASQYLDAGAAADLAPVRTALEQGRGFAIVEGVSPERFSMEERQVQYWLVGQLLGRPFEQNVQGTLLYDVRDEGKDVRSGARYSVTNAETGFHTDNSFGDEVLDYVGLLCLAAAKSGGVNQVVSGYSLHNELRTRHPDVLSRLYLPFHVDRRDGLRPGDAPTIQQPIMHWEGNGLVCRYLRYWIEAGHERVGRVLTPDERHALDVLDGVLREPQLQADFSLKPGDMFFVNNRWIFHNRTAFEDFTEPERRRHYVRLWLRRCSYEG
ncbi:MAG: TauD/TfdA family dioxygenase [Planctomycetes bacterium]|nr:TauD/TfdA family dioxygenase [Planctomycetota bacterium]